jgi:outer membrane protein assembly complex protein YaeT
VSKYGTASPSQPSLPHRVLVGLTWIACVIGLLIVVALIAIHTSPVRRFVGDRIAALLAGQHIDVNAREFDYNLFNASLRLGDVRIGSTAWRNGPALVTIGHAHITLSLRQLLRGRYVVQSGSVEDVDVHYLVDEHGHNNLPRPPARPESTGTPLDYFVSSFTIANARVRYEDRVRNVDAVLPLQSVEVRGAELTGRHAIRLEAAGGELQLGDRRVTIDRLSGNADLGRDDLAIDRIEIDIAGSRVDMQGAVTLSTRLVELRSLQVRAPWGGVAAKGRLAANGSGESHVQADVTNLDAATLMRSLQLPVVAATQVDGTLQAAWPGLEYLKARGTAEATLRATTAATPSSAMPLSGRLVGRGDGSRIDATLQQLTVPGAVVNGHVEVSGDRLLRGAVTGRSADIGQLISSIESMTGRPQGSLLAEPVTGGVNIEAQLGGSLDAPTATTIVKAGALALGATSGFSLDAAASYAARAITIGRGELTWNGARAQLEGHVGTEPGAPIELRLSADSLSVESLLRAANLSPVPVSGAVTAKATVRGTLSRPVARLVAEGTNLVAYEEHIGSVAARIDLNGPELTLSDLVVDKPQPGQPGRLSATGSYHLDQRTYTFDLQSHELKLLGLVLPDGQRVRADLRQLTARGAGSLDSPEGVADLDIAAIEIDLPGWTERAEDDTTGTSRLGRLIVNGVAKGGEATITAQAESLNLDARATVGLTEPWPATLTLSASDLDLSAPELHAALATSAERLAGLHGQLRATVDASGNLSELPSGHATITLESLMGTWNGRPFTVTTSSPLQYADERLAIDDLRVDGRDTSLTIGGDLPLTDRTAPGEISIDLRGSLATLSQYAPPDINLSADGAVTLTGSLRGTLRRVEPHLTLTVDDGLVLSPQLQPGFSDIVLRARVENGAADIERFDANWGTATVQVSGRVPLDAVPGLPLHVPPERQPATLKALVSGLDPSSLPGMPPELGGRISIEADVTAPGPDLSALDGRVTFQELDVTLGGLDLSQRQPATIVIASGGAMVDQFHLSGSAGTITAGGRVGLDRNRALDLEVDGTVNIAALSIVTDQIRTEGDSTLKLSVRGTMASPELTGTIDLMNATAVSNDPNVAAENINAHLDLDGRRMSLTRFEADVNGGTVSASGTVTLGERVVRDVDLEISAKEVAYDAPLDLRSVSNATIRVTRSGGDTIVVKGKVTIEEAGLTEDINLDAGLLGRITARRDRDVTEQRNPLLERVRFDIDVATATPVLVDNNLARAEIEGDVHVVGTLYEPGLLGALTLVEGSEILLNERRYHTERGVITFVDERRIVPSLDLRLNTTVSSYDVTIVVTGTPGHTETTLTSVPSRPEADILAMLMTGRTFDELRGEELEVARNQVLSSLAGRAGSTLGRGIQQATGFSEVRIEPTLIANEADPSARLTVGQALTSNAKVVYSLNLADSNDQIWIVEYDLTRRFQARGVWQDDGSYRFDFRRDLRFGGRPESPASERVRARVSDVTVTADGGDESAVRAKFGVKAGDTYDFFAIRTGVRRVEDSLVEQGYLQSRVRVERQVEGERASLRLHVTLGPQVAIVFMGAMPPRRVERELGAQWHKGVFDKQRGDDGAETLRQWLMDDNYLRAKVEYRIDDVTEKQRRVVFEIQPGMRSQRVVVAFEGASAINPDQLDRLIAEQQLERRLFTDPLVVTDVLERYYRARGYLSAHIDEPRFEFEGEAARVVLAIQEGPRFTVRAITFSGNVAYDTSALLAHLPIAVGESFVPAAAENALTKIRDLYWTTGYNDVRLDYELVVHSGAGEVDVAFAIVEGRQSVIADISIAGNDRVSDHLVREQIQLSPAEPLDLNALARSRRSLYGTGAFSLVDITRREIEGAPADSPNEVHLDVDVREVPPFQLRYGASYDTERGVGVILDASNRNSLGGARELGIRSRYDGQLRDIRFFINQPALTHRYETTLTVYFREELNPPSELTDPFDVSRKGVSIQQQRRLRNRYLWTYGYKYERAHTLTPTPVGILDEMTTVSPLTATLTRETRDVILDASSGAFLSQALSFSPTWLGAEQPFVKYFGQYFHYFPLQPQRQNPLTGQIIRPRLVFASGVRLGLASGLGEVVPRTERFFAGGSATLRGFEQNTVGPITPERFALGGEALLVLNNEVRVPLISMFDGVFFVDIGNVFGRVRDFSLTNLRQSAGIGLRLRTSWLLLRGDYGVVLDPRPGEQRSQFYLSVGQAF